MSGAIEAIVLTLVALAPWAFGAVEPRFEFLLDGGVAVGALLWGAKVVLEGRAPRPSPVVACLIALVLIGVLQQVALPREWLRVVAPATARVYDQLLPNRPEVLPRGSVDEGPTRPPGTTLSLDPGATRRQVIQLVAVVLLWTITLDGVASVASLRRLSLVALINGSLLALFGLVQSFSTDTPGLIYWSIATAGHVFGPFVNRNHFAFYQNLCLGLALGGVLARSAQETDPTGAVSNQRKGGWVRPWVELLRDPTTLGMVLGLALMVSSVAFTLSRGGFLALLGGGGLGLICWVRQPSRRIQGGPLLVGGATILALVGWFGFDQVATRLESLRGPEVLEDRRLAVHQRSLQLVRDFPVAGTGYGTFEYVDGLHRADGLDAGVFFEHAHDDYLEVLVEGGLVQLVPSLLAIVLVVASGWRVIRQANDRATQALALGALAAFATTLIHGFTDFGLHIPANTVLTTVVAAQMVALGRRTVGGGLPAASPVRRGWWSTRLVPLSAAILATTLGAVVVAEGWRQREAQRLRTQAARSGEVFDAASRRQKVSALREAVRLVPDNAQIRGELMAALLEAYNQQLAEAAERAAGSDSNAAGPNPGPEAERSINPPSTPERDWLVPALVQLRSARNLNPLRVASHLDLAIYADQFAQADSPATYRNRARWLAPSDPEVWYRCGAAELAAGRVEQAWADWQHSLTLSSMRLPAILDEAAPRLSGPELVRLVLPQDPVRLLAAADGLGSGPPETRRAILEAAQALLATRSPLTPEDQHLRARLDRALGHPREAAEALRAALSREPLRLPWRRELAEVLRELGQFEAARQELLTVLGLQPDDDQTRSLLDAITQQVAEGK